MSTVLLGEVNLPLLMDTSAVASLLNTSTYPFFSHLPHLSMVIYAWWSLSPSPLWPQTPVIISFYIPEWGANLLRLDSFRVPLHSSTRTLPNHSTPPQLLKIDKPCNWTAACSKAVHMMMSQLNTPPILAHFDPDSPTIVTCQ